ncbi:hypothetical protein LPJ59_001611 [Coemansia sp. RSA 2399]|nr:hypothetical protein LPJ59_001611 [Coemansia sp. RSA 2399]KAJ1902876.1 hypothetical protein LPJ81_003361 [Coemansia sp. IMI 209127]
MPFNVDYNSRVPEDSPDATQHFQDQQHHHGIKESLEKAADKVKNAFTSNKKEEHDHAYQSGATDPVPMSSDPRVEPLHNVNPPEAAARYDNVHVQDNIYSNLPPQYPSK